MKRSKEVSIILDALLEAGMLDETKADKVRHIIREAIKKIRCEQYAERKTKN